LATWCSAAAQAALNTFLPILHSHCLPALPANLEAAQSAAAAAFCESFLQAWQQQQQQQQQQSRGQTDAMDADPSGAVASSSSASDGVADAQLHSCLLLALLAAHCSSEDHRQLMLLGCEWVSTAAAAAAAAEQGLSEGPGPACLAAAVLCAARPGLLIAPSVADLAVSLAGLSTANTSNSYISELDRNTAGIALASVVHKCCAYTAQHHMQQQSSGTAACAVTGEVLLDAALPQLLQCLQQQVAGCQQQQQQQRVLGSVRALSWVSRGLALQRHDGWQQCMQAVLQVLLQVSADVAAAQQDQTQQQLLWAAAEFFSVLVASPLAQPAAFSGSLSSSSSSSSSSSGAQLGLQLSLHCSVRPLWQQKAFTIALQPLADTISSQQQGAAAAAAESQRQQQQGLGLWLAVACLLSSAPPALASTARDTAVPLLLQCLVRLADAYPTLAGSSSSSDSAAAAAAGHHSRPVRLLQLLHSCLLMVADLLVSAGQSAGVLEVHIGTLLDVLCRLARLTPGSSAASTQVVAGKLGQSTSGSSSMPAAAAPPAAGISSKMRAEVAAGAAAVREVALMCLTSVMGLPYHLLHPYRWGCRLAPQTTWLSEVTLVDKIKATAIAAV
jgi:hypothetical protein